MTNLKAKKHLGQHFLTDNRIAERIVDSLSFSNYDSVLEVGPGKGILTGMLMRKKIDDFRVIEIDREAVDYLAEKYPELRIIEGDFLKFDMNQDSFSKIAVIGNFPYNISTQILFRVLENKHIVEEVVGMFQKEVADRICSGPGSKRYGILSVLLKIYYNIEYLFSVPANVFSPVPKVTSAVIRLRRNQTIDPGCNEQLLIRVVKAVFNQRRKMVRNSLKALLDAGDDSHDLLTRRPEQLGLEDFIVLTNWVEERYNSK